MSTELKVRRTEAADWERYRDLRLEMLADTPLAYAESLESAGQYDEDQWKARAATGSSEDSILLVAIAENDRWVGTMTCLPYDGGPGVLLVAVYVTPDYRGASFGVMDVLLTGIEEWAHARAESITLHVHETNFRAQAAYANRGFVFTGRTIPYELDGSQNELEMLKNLD
ncbi:GNAT family N-acetyltransferase [Glaciihabitans sp. UYNi722]|uniref:GNAT family N-acetyltransferase n=1 Tax=Glaciihabitans sp. UYNi722 TaxID=3156344 RepID=UPI00339757BA